MKKVVFTFLISIFVFLSSSVYSQSVHSKNITQETDTIGTIVKFFDTDTQPEFPGGKYFPIKQKIPYQYSGAIEQTQWIQ